LPHTRNQVKKYRLKKEILIEVRKGRKKILIESMTGQRYFLLSGGIGEKIK